MREATITELHDQTRHFLDLVAAGEIIRVLRNGKPIAEILPLHTPSWKKRHATPLAVSGANVSRWILDERCG